MAVLEKLEELGAKQRFIILGIIVLLLAAFTWQYVYKPKSQVITGLEAQYAALQTDLQSLRVIAAKLPEFQEQTKMLQEKLEDIRRQLPQKKEIPGLLENISRAGTENGLEFDLFRPRKEVDKGFYVEVPVDITIMGPFHNIALFLDKVVHFPRIVNISTFTFSQAKEEAGYVFITGKCLATTYRYTERG